jgi:hypothetical protein
VSDRERPGTDYRVTWEIDIEQADTARAAALEAYHIMLDPDSIATVFAVTSPERTTELIDLLSEDADGLPRADG